LEKPDAVINLVAIPSINPCEENPDLAFSVHVTAPLTMIKTCSAMDITYVQASSHAVFDGTKIEPYTERDQPNPGSVYAVSKYASECLTANLCPKHYIVRLATMYGNRRNDSLGFVDKMVKMIRSGQKLRVADDKIDSPSYARDVAELLLSLLTEKHSHGIYHLANSGMTSYYEFVCVLRDLLGANNIIDRAKDRDFPALGLKPLRTALKSIHLDPIRSWQDALEDYVTADLRL
jgi:dTDP-4-dehydrorhamnose reductase